MMNWFIEHLIKEARGRRFDTDDRVRYFTDKRKGKGSVVLTPSFSKGTVVNYDRDSRRYKVKNDKDEMIDVHPRNIVPDSFSRSPAQSPVQISPDISPVISEPISEEITTLI
jgi:hypothetical protein